MFRSFRALFVTGLCLALAALTTAAFAGPGDLDKTFSGDGAKTVDYAGASDTLYGITPHKNAPTACGSSNQQATLTAFTPKGGLDKSFSGDGMWRQDILGHGNSYLEACRFLPDGRLVAVGGAYGADGHYRTIVVVRRPNGKPDTSFSGDGLAVYRFAGIDNSAAYDLAIQPDGKIVVAGEGYDSGVSPQKGFFEVARLRPNGALDKTFNGDGLAKVDFARYDEGAWKVKLLHDGTVVLAGWLQNKAGTEWNSAVAELKPNGALDRSFSGDGMAVLNFLKGADDYPLGLDVRPGGTIVLGLYRYNGSYLAAVAQLRPNGAIDGSFGGGDGLKTGLGPDLDVQDLMLAGGKILLAGGSGSGSTPFVLRLTQSGNLDGTFGNHGQADLSAVSGYLFDIAIDAQGRVDGVGNSVSDGLVIRVHA
ncbi:MAG TPA: hypothetical protein VGQ50_14180 [Actinomycetota bacterium]|nr:hypothetical protein [Actinomycetota bacterium]